MGGLSRNVPTPGRIPSSTRMSLATTRQQGVNTLPAPGRQHRCQIGSLKQLAEPLNRSLMIQTSTAPLYNRRQNPLVQTLHQRPLPPELTKQCRVEELRSTVQTAASSTERGTWDVHHLSQKMVPAAMITDNAEENGQALSLLTAVVHKLQGIIVAGKSPELPPPRGLKQHAPSPPPSRVSSVSSKVIRNLPTSYSQHLSSSSSRSSSSSYTSVSSGVNGFTTPRSPNQTNRGSTRPVVRLTAVHRVSGCAGNNQEVCNGSISGAPLDDQQDRNSTGCLATKKKKKNN